MSAGVSGDRRLVALKELRKAELTTGVPGVTPNQENGS